MKDWKIKVDLDECNTPFGGFKDYPEIDIPFAPKVGDRLWLSEELKERIEGMIKKCYNVNKCENCPLVMLSGDVDISDFTFVSHVLHDIEHKQTIVSLKEI